MLIAATLKKEAFAHAFTGPMLMLIVVSPVLRWANSSASDPNSTPAFSTMYWQFLVSLVINDTLFYFGHRALHHKTLYGLIHKQHHSYTGTRSFAAEYAHVVEDVVTAYIVRVVLRATDRNLRGSQVLFSALS